MSIYNLKYENMPGERMLTIKKNSSVCFFPFYLHPKTSKQLQILPIDKNYRTGMWYIYSFSYHQNIQSKIRSH